MAENVDGAVGAGVLRSKRNTTRYQILAQIAERQPAVNQREIADAIGITAQAVSEYLKHLVEEGYVDKHGRGRYEVTNEGVDWLITQTDALREFVDHVSEDVIEQVEITTAIADTAVEEGQTVSLTMHDGVERVRTGDTGTASAVAVTDAEPGRDVGVTNVEGVIDYDLGTVTVVSVPEVQDGGSAAVDPDAIAHLAGDNDVVATAGTEALVAARAADLHPAVRFGTVDAVLEAATKGLDVLLLATASEVSAHTDRFRERNIGYEVVDSTDG